MSSDTETINTSEAQAETSNLREPEGSGGDLWSDWADGTVPEGDPYGIWYRALVETSMEGLAVLDEQGRFQFAAPSTVRLLGIESLDVIGTRFVDLIHPEDRRHGEQVIAGLLTRPGASARMQLRLRHKDRSWRWIEWFGSNPQDRIGRQAVVCSFQDITRRRQIELQTRQSQDHFRTIFQACPLPIGITTAREGRFLEVNPAFLRLTGFALDEVLGRTATELRLWVNPSDRDWLVDRMRASGSVHQHQTVFRTRSGRSYDALVSIEALRLNQQDCWLVITSDITEQQRLERESRRVQRLEQGWALARGIAHDLNNMLTPVLTAGELLLERGADAATLELLESLRSNAQRGAHLVRQILSLARGDSHQHAAYTRSAREGIATKPGSETTHTSDLIRLTNGERQGILLVDDEAAMIELLRSMLESLDFRVWTARDGLEGLEVYQRHRAEIRLVVTDLAMPRMDGPELIGRIKESEPAVRVICTSGLDAGHRGESLPGVDGFLFKPFTLGQFLELLKELLGRPA
jgi:PAS domain S-box-containing protein